LETAGRIGNLFLATSSLVLRKEVAGLAMVGTLRGFSDEETRLILADALAPAADARTEQAKAARRWVHWLAAYTGAMVGEIVRIRRQDVVEVEGIPSILLGAKQKPEAKAAARLRTVPLHPHLVEQGFVEFTQSRADGPLFFGFDENPDLVARRIGERVRKLGIADKSVSPTRGWRWRFIIELSKAGVRRGLVDKLLGRVIMDVAPKWRSDPVPVWCLRDAIATLPKIALQINQK
jgi:integrase